MLKYNLGKTLMWTYFLEVITWSYKQLFPQMGKIDVFFLVNLQFLLIVNGRKGAISNNVCIQCKIHKDESVITSIIVGQRSTAAKGVNAIGTFAGEVKKAIFKLGP